MNQSLLEHEEKGIYTAEMTHTLQSGSILKQVVEVNLKSIQEGELKKWLQLGLDIKTISTRVNVMIDNAKKEAILELKNLLNKKIKLHDDSNRR